MAKGAWALGYFSRFPESELVVPPFTDFHFDEV